MLDLRLTDPKVRIIPFNFREEQMVVFGLFNLSNFLIDALTCLYNYKAFPLVIFYFLGLESIYSLILLFSKLFIKEPEQLGPSNTD